MGVIVTTLRVFPFGQRCHSIDDEARVVDEHDRIVEEFSQILESSASRELNVGRLRCFDFYQITSELNSGVHDQPLSTRPWRLTLVNNS